MNLIALLILATVPANGEPITEHVRLIETNVMLCGVKRNAAN